MPSSDNIAKQINLRYDCECSFNQALSLEKYRVELDQPLIPIDTLNTQQNKLTVKTRVGVLINNFNNGPWLRACIDSAIGQSFKPDEIIVYDDGSTDESLSILREYADRIKVIEGIHNDSISAIESQARAVHAAFAASSADHLYLLDGDDVFMGEKIARYEQAWANNPEAVLIQAPTVFVDATGKVQRDGYEELKHPPDGDFLAATYRTQDTDLYYSTSALAFSRAFLERFLPLDFSDGIALAVDSRLSSVAPLHGQVLTLDESLTLWRQHPRSVSHRGDQRSPLAGTIRRNRYFNSYAQKVKRRRISLWLNLRYYRQLGRRILPRWMTDPFAKSPTGKRPQG